MGITVTYRGMLPKDLARRQNSDDYVNSDEVTPAVKHGIKYLVDFIRQPDGKSLGNPRR